MERLHTETGGDPAPPEELRLQLLTSPTELHALEPEWNQLVQASMSNNVFLTGEWMRAWVQWLGTDCAMRLWTVRRVADGHLLGLAPLALRRRRTRFGLRVRELILLGSDPTAADHIDFIVHRDAVAAVSPLLRTALKQTLRECDLSCLEGLAPDSPVLSPWLKSLPAWTLRETMPCPYIDLPATWDGYLGGLKKKTRQGINRTARALTAHVQPAQVVYRRVVREEDLSPAMDQLIRLHQSDQTALGHPGVFADLRLERFHRDVARHFLRNGWLYLTLMEVSGRPIAAVYNFIYGDALGYLMGYDRAWQQFGPGRQVVARSIQDAIATGVQRFDLLRGAEPYKRLLTNTSRNTLTVRTAETLYGALFLGSYAIVRHSCRIGRNLRTAARRLVKGKASDDI